MSGHSKWSTIKRKKAKEDAKRGKIFTKIIKEITVAAKEGGGDSDSNPRLRSAIDLAKSANMPKDNIEKAIKKGTGELPGVVYEEFSYEGYGPAGIAIIVDTLSDNKNRTTAEVRHMFSKYNGNLGEKGCVSWMFESKGLIMISKERVVEDVIFEIAIDSGAEDIKTEGEYYEIFTQVSDLYSIKEILEEKGIPLESVELGKFPTTLIDLEKRDIERNIKLLTGLEDLDDVNSVFSNMNIPDDFDITE
ncbi:YebC/PmpR family DNA-binding transcriptional regulator [Candidatus Dependentiae bacterium]|nr:YebC/PmpR family DNA-binding transcriptional regulator [Candidatus Dependentiae bacterium]